MIARFATTAMEPRYAIMLLSPYIRGVASLSVLLAALFTTTVTFAAAPLRLATTTSTDNSGLLQVLLPPFEQETGIKVHVIAVGTGKALRMGRDGDVDLVLVHARKAEQEFVAEGYGVNRRAVMYNDFVVVGPREDPAGILGGDDVARALARIAQQQAPFVSRGDDSGTHRKERSLWRSAGLVPAGGWYQETGQGMGRVLQISDELDAYTITDRGTWLAYQGRLQGMILVQGDPRLHNPYGVIAVDPQRYPDIRYRAAMRLIAWLTSPRGQAIIAGFRVNGEVLFHPQAVKD